MWIADPERRQGNKTRMLESLDYSRTKRRLRIDGHGVSTASAVSNAVVRSVFSEVWLPVAIFGLMWIDVIYQLGYRWSTYDQYAYGWFVPSFSVALFWKRWIDRPTPVPSHPTLWMTVVVALLLLAYLPVRVIHDINRDWALCSWLLTLSAIGLSLCPLFLAGGRDWVKHFAFPVCFVLVAVGWPYRMERGMTQGLMSFVASMTVELLSWIGVPAFQHGNLIEVSSGVVGIDEACSGIRSFQSNLMGALFLGELYRLSWLRRVALLGGGVVLAILFNIGRASILTWRMSVGGMAALEKWHDQAGLIIFALTFAWLWMLSLGLQQRDVTEAKEIDRAQPAFLPRKFLMISGCYALCVFGLTEVWYHTGKVSNAGEFYWSFKLPTDKPSYKEIELPAVTRGMIRSDASRCGSWTDSDGMNWSVFFFRWNPTSIQSVLRARIHRPEACLSAAGLREVSDAGTFEMAAGRLKLPFRQYVFEAQGQNLYVFFCQWEDGSKEQTGVWDSKLADRIRSVLVRRRVLGQQTLEVVLTGPSSLEQAKQELERRLPGMIQSSPAYKTSS
jgi:exosortase